MSANRLCTRRAAAALIAALGLAVTAPIAQAQTADWPSKPVRLIVPFPAGGGADVAARAIANEWGQQLGKSFVVENKAGGDGIVASLEVMKAAPDGHTLYLATASGFSYVPALKKEPPYDPLADFTPISRATIFTFFLMASPSLGVNTLPALIAKVKAAPGTINYASGNSTSILATGQLVHANKLDMTHVPYKGEGQAILDLVGGRIPLMFATPAIIPQLQKEKFIPLAVLLPQRSSLFPDVPTMAEAGQPLVNIAPWSGLVGPAKMPADLVDKIQRGFVEVMKKPAIVEQMNKLGQAVTTSTPQDMTTFLREQLAIFKKAIADQGIQQE
jgi:tripartite-type tricarboxylate transporter receptor subunit TctC